MGTLLSRECVGGCEDVGRRGVVDRQIKADVCMYACKLHVG